jgi:hypothetical protein
MRENRQSGSDCEGADALGLYYGFLSPSIARRAAYYGSRTDRIYATNRLFAGSLGMHAGTVRAATSL